MNKYIELKVELVRRSLTNQEVADVLGIDRTTFSCKLNRYRGADFTLEEARTMCKEYNLPFEIFFTQEVPQT